MVDISVSDLDSHVLMKITGSIRLTDAESLKNPFEQVLDLDTVYVLDYGQNVTILTMST